MVLALSQAVGPRRRASAPRRRKKIHDDDDDKETTKRLQTVTELMVAHCHNCKSPHVPTKQCNVCLHNFCKQPDCGPAHLPCDKPVSYEPIKYKYDNVQVVADEGQLFMAVPGPLHNKLVRMHTTWSYVMRISATILTPRHKPFEELMSSIRTRSSFVL